MTKPDDRNAGHLPGRISSRLPAVVAFCLAAAILVYHLEYFGVFIDDSYITLRYARNLAEGRGLVYNPGERVEGYTNFLWALMLAGAYRAGGNGIVAARYLGLLFALGTLFLTASFSALVRGRARPGDWAAALLLSLNGCFALWSGAGLENGLFAFTALAGQALFLRRAEAPDMRRGLAWGSMFALAYFSRPDGGIFYAVACFLRLFVFREAGWRERLRETAAASAAFWLPVLAHLVWRWSYYGDLLPNTFYVKGDTGIDRIRWGLEYAWSFVRAYSPLLLLPPAALFALRRARRLEISVALFGLVYLAYVISIGGDRVFPYFRFFMVLLPNLYLLSGWGLESAWVAVARWSRGAAWAAVAIVIAALAGFAVWSSVRGHERERTVVVRETHDDGVVIGNWLGAAFPPGTWIALNMAGTVPYFSGLPAIDMLGLTDRHIARVAARKGGLPMHEKQDFEYVLDRKPAVIFYWLRLFQSPPVKLGFAQVKGRQVGFRAADDPRVMQRFRAEYSWEIFRVGDMYLGAFIRRDSPRPAAWR